MKIRVYRLCKLLTSRYVGLCFLILMAVYVLGAHFNFFGKRTQQEISTLSRYIIETIPLIARQRISEVFRVFECDLPPSQQQTLLFANRSLPFCPCVSEGLSTYRRYKETERKTHRELLEKYASVEMGVWSPADCISRHKMAVVVPYRDREDHLLLFLDTIHSYLQKQKISYLLIVAEQGQPQTFNKAKLMNAAFVESKKLSDFDCVLFHDIDLIPEDETNLYTCTDTVRHQGVAINIFDYKSVGDKFIGGVTVFRKEIFEKIDGYSNKFWGWGGEDDNLYWRVRQNNISFHRAPFSIAKYHMLVHERDTHNPINKDRFKLMNSTFTGDGLSTLKYKILLLRQKKLYVWMLLDLRES